MISAKEEMQAQRTARAEVNSTQEWGFGGRRVSLNSCKKWEFELTILLHINDDKSCCLWVKTSIMGPHIR